MDDPNITIKEYIMLEEEKACRCGKVYNWETATYGKIWCDEDVYDLRSVETEFPAIVYNDTLTSEVTLSCESTVSPLNNNQIDFRILFDESDDEDYMIIYDKNSFSYKIIFVDNLKMDLENDNDKVNMPSFLSSKPTVNYFDDFDYFNDFEIEFPTIAYNDALTSKLDFSQPTVIMNDPNITMEEYIRIEEEKSCRLGKVTDEIPLLCLYADCEPLVFNEAMKSKKWRQTLKEEIKSIEKNYTSELTTLSKGQKSIEVKWVYKAKKNAKGKVRKYTWQKVTNRSMAPHAWNTIIDKYFQAHGFTKYLSEYALYVKFENKSILLACLYVDDLIFTRNSQSMIDELKKSMTREFEMTDIVLMPYDLGIEVKQMDEEVFICQERHANEILKRFYMDKCNPFGTPLEHKAKPSKHDRGKAVDSTVFKSLVGSLRYLTCTRPDILFVIGLISCFMEEPTIKHLKISKRILYHIKGTVDYGMFYSISEDFKLVAYSDSDWAGSKDDGRSTSGVHSSWELHMEQEDATNIYVDNKSGIDLAKNTVYDNRSKPINTRYHFIGECIARKDVQEIHTSSKHQVVRIHNFSVPLMSDFESVTDWYQEPSIMDAPPSSNHVFNFPEVEFEEDPHEEPKEGFEEDPEEDPKEELEAEAEDDVPPPATPPVGSPITLPPLSKSSSDTEDVAPIVANEALEMPLIGSTYEVGGPSSVSPFPPFYLHGREITRLDGNTELLLSNVKYLERCEKKRKTKMEASSSKIRKVKKCMDEIGQDLGDEMQFSNLVEHRVTKLEDKDKEKVEEMEKMKKHLGMLETNY
uniref:Retrovirus-related Pol polyprotein from transposon TNT 1-94 n=1 Tax=Tanacetum cinerariifolium TaxID=118510 RepID=A0A6L2KZ17_TANCI|nr:retrovirus-related Pol polyprotein from transposon TNT 1-94 [Tanacetum cinerariifolium]